jgi:hypothetical protein
MHGHPQERKRGRGEAWYLPTQTLKNSNLKIKEIYQIPTEKIQLYFRVASSLF